MSAADSSRRVNDAELARLVRAGATELSLPLSCSDVDRMVAYVRLLERWNATYNLTSIRDPRDMVTHHIIDCLAAAAALIRRCGPGAGERLLDVGSGAGLPGIVIAVTSPAREVTCVDSVGKKVAFITQAVISLGLKNVKAVHARSESVVDEFDIIASRAFASLSEFVGLTRHLIKDSGMWMAMKGRTPDDELQQLKDGLRFEVERLDIPQLVDRCIVWIDQRKQALAHERN